MYWYQKALHINLPSNLNMLNLQGQSCNQDLGLHKFLNKEEAKGRRELEEALSVSPSRL